MKETEITAPCTFKVTFTNQTMLQFYNITGNKGRDSNVGEELRGTEEGGRLIKADEQGNKVGKKVS